MKRLNGVQKSLAPVVIFAYNRPRHLLNCLNSLKSNLESTDTDFLVFIDGPRNQEDKKKQKELINIIEKFQETLSLKVEFGKDNLGLAPSVINGLNKVFEVYEKAIIVEDDLVVSSFFLAFCNEGLDQYSEIKEVASIHGFSYKFNRPEAKPYFLRGADCWGWATWRDRWQLFESDPKKLIMEINLLKLRRRFDLEGAYPYYRMLERQSRNEISSWAIRWHASMFIANKLTLYPHISLVRNDGLDGSGTHATNSKSHDSVFPINKIELNAVPVSESKSARKKLKKYLKSHYETGSSYSLFRIYKGLFRRLSKYTKKYKYL